MNQQSMFEISRSATGQPVSMIIWTIEVVEHTDIHMACDLSDLGSYLGSI